jgi:hypothetical protein
MIKGSSYDPNKIEQINLTYQIIKTTGEYQGMVNPMEDRIKNLIKEFDDNNLGIFLNIMDATRNFMHYKDWKSQLENISASLASLICEKDPIDNELMKNFLDKI